MGYNYFACSCMAFLKTKESRKLRPTGSQQMAILWIFEGTLRKGWEEFVELLKGVADNSRWTAVKEVFLDRGTCIVIILICVP